MSDPDFGYKTGVPLVNDYIYGLRVWDPAIKGGSMLESVYADYIWSPGVNHAKCLQNNDTGLLEKKSTHIASPRCSCGFYAYFDGPHVAHAHYHTVLGVIRGQGRVSFGPKGFRVEKAEIVALYNPHMQKRRSMRTRLDGVVDWFGSLSFMVPASFWALGSVAINVPWKYDNYTIPAGFLCYFVGMFILACLILTRRKTMNGKRAAAATANAQLVSALMAQVVPRSLVGVSSSITPSRLEKIIKNYPDVKIYPTVEEMLANHPPSNYNDLNRNIHRHKEGH